MNFAKIIFDKSNLSHSVILSLKLLCCFLHTYLSFYTSPFNTSYLSFLKNRYKISLLIKWPSYLFKIYIKQFLKCFVSVLFKQGGIWSFELDVSESCEWGIGNRSDICNPLFWGRGFYSQFSVWQEFATMLTTLQ